MSDAALTATVRVAMRHYHDTTTTEAERDAMLAVAVSTLSAPEAELAARAQFHRRESETHQLNLVALLDRAPAA